MELFVDAQRRDKEFDGTIAELLRELDVLREEVVVKLNGEIAPDTAPIGPRDKVEVIKVVFGG